MKENENNQILSDMIQKTVNEMDQRQGPALRFGFVLVTRHF